jgi:precorrin-2 methylase
MRETGRMRELVVIGIGPGHPDRITVAAVAALNRVSAEAFAFLASYSDRSDRPSPSSAAKGI